MTAGVMRFLGGSSLMHRVLRSSAWTTLGFMAGQVIRLASNLILTRLLFPEAFGLMAMVSVFIMGLLMFSDVGVGPAIMQSKRGDDPDFLNTAWTIQICRGIGLFAVAAAMSYPMSLYFGEPELVHFLPVAALTLVVLGVSPTKFETANRHMRAGRITLIDLGSQVVGVVTAVVLALLLQSVWALVISGLVAAVVQLILLNLFLPGPRNRLRWEPAAASELIHFGKWVFLSTVCGFAIGQADKVIIGGYLSTADFGIYNIGYFLASFPMMLGGVVTRRVLIPIYRERPPAQSRANFLALRRMRMVATAGLMTFVMGPAFLGVWLVDVMYDPRYFQAGGMVVLIAVAQMPLLILMTYDQAALAAGDSRRFFVLALVRAALVIGATVAGLQMADLPGAIAGLGVAHVLSYPVVVWLARQSGAWDPLHDALFTIVGIVVGGVAIWLNEAHIIALGAMMAG